MRCEIGGGGISLHFAQPAYQVGTVPQSLATSTTTASGQTLSFSTPHRVVPDIAMDADPNTGANRRDTVYHTEWRNIFQTSRRSSLLQHSWSNAVLHS